MVTHQQTQTTRPSGGGLFHWLDNQSIPWYNCLGGIIYLRLRIVGVLDIEWVIDYNTRMSTTNTVSTSSSSSTFAANAVNGFANEAAVIHDQLAFTVHMMQFCAKEIRIVANLQKQAFEARNDNPNAMFLMEYYANRIEYWAAAAEKYSQDHERFLEHLKRETDGMHKSVFDAGYPRQ